MKKLVIEKSNYNFHEYRTKVTDIDIISNWIVNPEGRKIHDDLSYYYTYDITNTWLNNLMNGKGEFLNEFPEITNGNATRFIQTPIGIYIIEFGNKLAIYDILAYDEQDNIENPDMNLQQISPDSSIIFAYNMFNNPLGFRTVEFSGQKFIPTHSFRYSTNTYKKINVDYIVGSNESSIYPGYFEISTDITAIQYDYKPLMLFKFKLFKNMVDSPVINENINGNKKFNLIIGDSNNNELINIEKGKITFIDSEVDFNLYTDLEKGIILIDGTNYTKGALSKLKYTVKILCDENVNGIMEVC